MRAKSVFSDENRLRIAAATCCSVSEIIRSFGYHCNGNHFRTVKRYADEYGILLPKVDGNTKLASARAKTYRSLDDYLSGRFPIQTTKLKSKLYAAKIKAPSCEVCGQGEVWNGLPLTLHLDHIDGNRANNALDNLRILCPHCHSQTNTFAGRKLRKTNPVKLREKGLRSIRLHKQAAVRKTKIEWPSPETVAQMVKSSSYLVTGKTLGVSDNAVRKYLRKWLGLQDSNLHSDSQSVVSCH